MKPPIACKTSAAPKRGALLRPRSAHPFQQRPRSFLLIDLLRPKQRPMWWEMLRSFHSKLRYTSPNAETFPESESPCP
jgi:hypothetical protein